MRSFAASCCSIAAKPFRSLIFSFRPRLCAGQLASCPRLHILEPLARADRSADAFGLAQGRIGKGFVEGLVKKGGKIADALQNGATRTIASSSALHSARVLDHFQSIARFANRARTGLSAT